MVNNMDRLNISLLGKLPPVGIYQFLEVSAPRDPISTALVKYQIGGGAHGVPQPEPFCFNQDEGRFEGPGIDELRQTNGPELKAVEDRLTQILMSAFEVEEPPVPEPPKESAIPDLTRHHFRIVYMLGVMVDAARAADRQQILELSGKLRMTTAEWCLHLEELAGVTTKDREAYFVDKLLGSELNNPMESSVETKAPEETAVTGTS
jgi:hypothetical protein